MSGGEAPARDAVDWPLLLRLALGGLRLSPESFWTMTPAEFRAAVEGAQGAPLDDPARARLRALIAAQEDAP